jgi:hypothetical protein
MVEITNEQSMVRKIEQYTNKQIKGVCPVKDGYIFSVEDVPGGNDCAVYESGEPNYSNGIRLDVAKIIEDGNYKVVWTTKDEFKIVKVQILQTISKAEILFLINPIIMYDAVVELPNNPFYSGKLKLYISPNPDKTLNVCFKETIKDSFIEMIKPHYVDARLENENGEIYFK